jgi:uncharacterized C2H2 Zn-finger protein
VQEFVDSNVMATAAGGFLCKPCSKVFAKSSVSRHVSELHVNVGILYQCPMCHLVKNTKNTLKNHVYKQHPELKGIDYNQCQVKED